MSIAIALAIHLLALGVIWLLHLPHKAEPMPAVVPIEWALIPAAAPATAVQASASLPSTIAPSPAEIVPLAPVADVVAPGQVIEAVPALPPVQSRPARPAPPVPHEFRPPAMEAPRDDTGAATAVQSRPVDASSVPTSPAAGRRAGEKDDWQGLVASHLDRFKRYPASAKRRGLQDIVHLRFVLDRQGNVVSLAIDRSAGIGVLDNEALAMVRRAAPFPPPPSGVAGEQIELTVPVSFSLN